MPPKGLHRPGRKVDATASIREQLSGGDPRTLGNAVLVLDLVLAEPDRLDELISCILDDDDEIVRMRASDALEKICRAQPSLLQPHVPLLLGSMSHVDQPSVQWHVAQMLGHVRLTAPQRERAGPNPSTEPRHVVRLDRAQLQPGHLRRTRAPRPHPR